MIGMPECDLERAYDDHAGSVFAFALTLTRSEDGAREVLQEVFRKLAVGGEARFAVDDLRRYLLRMTRHCVIDRRRGEGARQRALAASQESGRWSWFAPSVDTDAEVFRAALTDALASLPTDQRVVVHLKLWEGRTFAEIAALLDVPANTVASRYRYGLEKLRTTLFPLYEEIRHLPAP
jgi:RNA polymerase sigma-70 factor (ECF subfamily)